MSFGAVSIGTIKPARFSLSCHRSHCVSPCARVLWWKTVHLQTKWGEAEVENNRICLADPIWGPANRVVESHNCEAAKIAIMYGMSSKIFWVERWNMPSALSTLTTPSFPALHRRSLSWLCIMWIIAVRTTDICPVEIPRVFGLLFSAQEGSGVASSCCSAFSSSA